MQPTCHNQHNSEYTRSANVTNGLPIIQTNSFNAHFLGHSGLVVAKGTNSMGDGDDYPHGRKSIAPTDG